MPGQNAGRWGRRVERFNALGLALLLLMWLAGTQLHDTNAALVLLTHCPALAPIALAGSGLGLALLFRAWRGVALAVVSTLIAVLALGGLELHRSSSANHAPLTLVTYNVEKWSHSGQRVGRVLKQAGPSVFCLQEAGRYHWVDQMQQQLRDFQQQLPNYRLVWAEEVAIGTTLPIVRHRQLPLPGLKSRPLLEAVLQLPDGQLASVLSAHWLFTSYFERSAAGLSQAAQAREHQARFVVDHVNELEHPAIVCGDLNADFRSAAIRLLASEMRDAWQERGCGFGFTMGFPWRRIDYIFVRGFEVSEARVLAAQASDHLPVWAALVPRSATAP